MQFQLDQTLNSFWNEKQSCVTQFLEKPEQIASLSVEMQLFLGAKPKALEELKRYLPGDSQTNLLRVML